MVSRAHFTIPPDSRGNVPPGAMVWTGEVQYLAHTAASTAATEITVPGPWYYFWATTDCHIVIGNAGIHAASTTAKNRCFPIGDGGTAGWVGPIYVGAKFDTLADGSGSLYIRTIRNAADGALYIASGFPGDDSLNRGATSTSTTTTSTSTTTTSTSTTSTSTTTTSTTT